MEKRGGGMTGKIIAVIFLLISVAFAGMLVYTKMIPEQMLAIIGVCLLVLVFLVGILTWNRHHLIRFGIGTCLAVVLSAVYILGDVYVYKTTSTIAQISGVTTEIAQVGIYVRTDDEADSIETAQKYNYGILAELDRESTDGAVEQIKEEMGEDVTIQEYQGLTDLIDALMHEETDAIVLNQAYMGVIEEMEGYSDVDTKICQIDTKNIETVIETKSSAKAENQSFHQTEESDNSSTQSTSSNDSDSSNNDKSVNETNSGSDSNENSSNSSKSDTDKNSGNDSESIKISENSSTSSQGTSVKEGKVYTILISGIDNRGGIVAKSRSDVNIIATVNTATRQILLVSTPRDYFVPLSISNGVPDKLTHAGIYGISVCMDTLGMLYDIDINNYIRLNFDGFIKIIDALGGITVNSEYDFDTDAHHFDKGENVVDGEAALAFARERYAFASGDRQRGKNQMAVIKGVIDKILSPELLKNYSSILSSVEGCFETNLSYDEIASLCQQQLSEGGSWNVVSYSVDGTGDSQQPYSMNQYAYVMVPDDTTVDHAKELMAKVRGGEKITQE